MKIRPILDQIDSVIAQYQLRHGVKPPRIVLRREQIEALREKGVLGEDMQYRDVQVVEQ